MYKVIWRHERYLVKLKFVVELWEGSGEGACVEDVLVLEYITISASGAPVIWSSVNQATFLSMDSVP